MPLLAGSVDVMNGVDSLVDTVDIDVVISPNIISNRLLETK